MWLWDDELETLHLRAMAECADATTPDRLAALHATLSAAASAARRQRRREPRTAVHLGSGKSRMVAEMTAEESW